MTSVIDSKPLISTEPAKGRSARSAAVNHAGMGDLQLMLGAQPVRIVVAALVGLDFLGRPVGQFGGKRRLGAFDAVGLGNLRVAARKQRFGGEIERPQQRALPAGPDARADGADVAGRQDHQQRQPVGALHQFGETLRRFRVLDVARLGDLGHGQVIADEPGDGVGFGGGQPETRAELARDARTGDRMVLVAALGDVMQEQRDEQQVDAGQMR